MAQDGFSVEYESLEQLGHELGDLADEVDGVEDDVEPYQEALGLPPQGGRDPGDELGSFAGNWDEKRGKIVDRLQELSEMAVGAADAYRDTDEGTAAGFRE